MIWDTNSQPHVIATVPCVITNGGWQHVALTYDTNSGTAVLYTTARPRPPCASQPEFVPRTSGDVYLGYDPTIHPDADQLPQLRFDRRAQPGRQLPLGAETSCASPRQPIQ